MKTTNTFANLSVKGTLEINDAYTLPSADGSFGYVMITDGVGGVTWVDPGTLALDTDDVTEATNLYYTDERVDDRVALLVQDGTGLVWTYVDGSNTFTGNVTLAPFSTTDLSEGTNLYFTDERVDDRVGSLIINGTGLSWAYDDGANTLTGTVSLAPFDTDDLAEGSTNLYLTDEAIDDRVSLLIQDGTGLTWTYNDPADTLTGNVSLTPFSTTDLSEGTNLYYTDERVDDRVSTLIIDTATITWAYNDGAGTLEATALSSPIEVEEEGVLVSTRDTINFIDGAGINISVVDNGANTRADVTITSTITQTDGTVNKVFSDGIQVGDADIEILNFSNKFTAVEGPDKTVTLDLSMNLSELDDVITLSPIVNDDILQYNTANGKWENKSLSEIMTLDQLSNVALTSPISDNEILIFNNATGLWTNGTAAAAAISLNDITDVQLTSPIADGDLISYNSATGKWENIVSNVVDGTGVADEVTVWLDGNTLTSYSGFAYESVVGTDSLTFHYDRNFWGTDILVSSQAWKRGNIRATDTSAIGGGGQLTMEIMSLGKTAGVASTTLYVDGTSGSEEIQLHQSKPRGGYSIEINVIASRDDGSLKVWKVNVAAKSTASGTTTFVGSPTYETIAEDGALTGYTFTVAITAGDTLRLTGTSDTTGTTIWSADTRVQALSWDNS